MAANLQAKLAATRRRLSLLLTLLFFAPTATIKAGLPLSTSDGDDGAAYAEWCKKRAMRVEVYLEESVPGEYARTKAMQQKERVVLAEDLMALDDTSKWTWDEVEWL